MALYRFERRFRRFDVEGDFSGMNLQCEVDVLAFKNVENRHPAGRKIRIPIGQIFLAGRQKSVKSVPD